MCANCDTTCSDGDGGGGGCEDDFFLGSRSIPATYTVGLTPIDGGYRVKLNASGSHYLDLLEMSYFWDLVTSPAEWGDTPQTWDRGWCYERPSKLRSFLDARAAAEAWDGDDDTEPEGYGEWLGSVDTLADLKAVEILMMWTGG